MKTLHRSSGIDWYITNNGTPEEFSEHGDNVIAHTIGINGKKLLSLANIEEKIREWDANTIRISIPYQDG